MVKTCVAVGCRARDNNKESERNFHSFPFSRPDICQQWVRNINRKDEKTGLLWQPTIDSRICSDHFTALDYDIDTAIKKLKPSAVPTIFHNLPQSQRPKLSAKRPSSKKKTSANKQPVAFPPNVSSALKVAEHTYCSLSEETELGQQVKSKMESRNKEAKGKRTEMRSLNQELRRKDIQISKLLNDMAYRNILSEEQHDRLKTEFDEKSFTLMENELKAPSANPLGMQYSEDVKKFAVTLHFYGNQAYDYVGKFLSLPPPSSIQQWATSRHGNPGFLSEVFETLKSTLTEETKDIALMFDCMRLEKDFVYDEGSRSFVGSSDFGPLSIDDEDTPAKQALTVMIVGLKKHFKQTIAYFFIDQITGETQAQIIKDSLILLSDVGFLVHAVVSEGSYTNQTTATLLGCILNPAELKSSFAHPVTKEPVFFIFDVCQLIENVGYCLGNFKHLYHEGDVIDWEYIVNLDKLQRSDNWVLENKIRGKHVDFEKNKMNVKFAVRPISSSVADAIDFLREDLSLSQFSGSMATTRFLRIFDKLLDLCNSSTPNGKGMKRPMTEKNLSLWIFEIEDAVDYIKRLKDSNGTPLVQARRRSTFMGLICTLDSLVSLSERLVNFHQYKYFMPYRLSLHHLGTLFSHIRDRKSGRNDDPFAAQFKWALRALLLKQGVLPSKKASCAVIEEPSNRLIKPEEDKLFSSRASEELEPFIASLSKPSIYHVQVLFHISGFIARKISERIECSKCTQSFLAKDKGSQSSVFTQRCSKGDLLLSDDMFVVIKSADKHLRNILTSKGIIKGAKQNLIILVTRNVLEAVSTQVYPDIWAHSLAVTNLESEDSHVIQIIKESSLEYPLHAAVRTGSVNELRKLLATIQGQAEVNRGTYDMVRPLHEACQVGNLEVAVLLHDHGAEINLCNIDGATALSDACSRGSSECISFLLEKGADVNPTLTSTSPLHELVFGNHPHCLNLLLQHGARLESSDLWNGTPLHLAVKKGFLECAKILLAAGANVNTSKNHETPLHLAAADGGYDLVELLLECGANVYAEDNRGRTAVHLVPAESPDCRILLDSYEKNPKSLRSLCRLCIRKDCGPKRLHLVPNLPLPEPLIRYLEYR